VIGAGVMGAGIAQWISARGGHVILRDIDANRVAAGMATVASLYASGQRRHTFTAREARAGRDRVSPAPTEVPLRQVGLVIEAAVEKMEVKKTIFRRLDELVSEDAILATNTSALSITELAAATRHPHRVVGLHFFNPVHKMQLIEVVTGRDTAPEVAQRTLRFAQAIGKLPVLVKDSPGFLVNRILIPYMIEAGVLFWEGASVQDIDEAMLDFGMPMGPLRLIDEVGADVALDVAGTLAAAFPERMRVPEILPAMIEAGLLGRKKGQGFYRHGKSGEAKPNKAVEALRPARATSPPRETLAKRMVLLLVNEAARCLEEGIVEAAADVDFAMVMGTGFAPFRGGPLRYADSVGAAQIVEDLERLTESAGAHYAPCTRLRDMARTNGRFYES
jgi:3-hydroxyacyl-CoA dehydrogenase/enoyl-CoA hydratase/3-hydroxybutyryl-CoA epimerase